jgi:YHS domain-containing protein
MQTRRALLTAAALLCLTTAAAPQEKIFTEIIRGVAVGGYDPVAYFTEGRPRQGSAAITVTHAGATWRFASERNREAFLANPAAFAPQFGGHCAWAAAEGYLAKGDPAHWRIVAGKLYLNYDASIQRRWERDIPGFIRQGDANWPKLGRGG